MFEACDLRGIRFVPARFCAPLAGYTHSAFRRLVAGFGGCGAFWTEMLAARQILKEDFGRSPWVRRRPEEGRVIFQLMTRAGDPLDRILDRLGAHGVEAVDLNLACDTRLIRSCESGSALFENLEALRRVLGEARRHWPGLLTAKIRLGSRRPDWRTLFAERVRVLEDAGLDALTVHPRFFEDKFRRRARHELLPWVATLTRLPLIANGDLAGPASVRALADALQSASAVMIGRMAVAQPWLFATWDHPGVIDYARTWWRMHDYILEDFDAAVALRRIQMFARFYSANFVFGHAFRCDIGRAATLEDLRRVAEAFFARGQPVLPEPVVAGR